MISIQRLDQRNQTVVAAFQEERIAPEPFYVRVVLSEHPNGIDLAKAENLVEIDKGADGAVNGVASELIVGEPFLRRAQHGVEVADIQRPQKLARSPTSLPHPSEGGYEHEVRFWLTLQCAKSGGQRCRSGPCPPADE